MSIWHYRPFLGASITCYQSPCGMNPNGATVRVTSSPDRQSTWLCEEDTLLVSNLFISFHTYIGFILKSPCFCQRSSHNLVGNKSCAWCLMLLRQAWSSQSRTSDDDKIQPPILLIRTGRPESLEWRLKSRTPLQQESTQHKKRGKD